MTPEERKKRSDFASMMRGAGPEPISGFSSSIITKSPQMGRAPHLQISIDQRRALAKELGVRLPCNCQMCIAHQWDLPR